MNPVQVAFHSIKEEQIYLPIRRAERISNYITVESLWGPIRKPGKRKEVIVDWQGKKETELIKLPDYLRPVSNKKNTKTREDIRNFLILSNYMPSCTYRFSIKYWAEYYLPYNSPVPTIGSIIVRCFESKHSVLGFPTIALNNTGRWRLFASKNGIPEDRISEVELVDFGWITQKFLDTFTSVKLSKVFRWMRLPEETTVIFYQALSPIDERGRDFRVHTYDKKTNILSPDGGYLSLSKNTLIKMMQLPSKEANKITTY